MHHWPSGISHQLHRQVVMIGPHLSWHELDAPLVCHGFVGQSPWRFFQAEGKSSPSCETWLRSCLSIVLGALAELFCGMTPPTIRFFAIAGSQVPFVKTKKHTHIYFSETRVKLQDAIANSCEGHSKLWSVHLEFSTSTHFARNNNLQSVTRTWYSPIFEILNLHCPSETQSTTIRIQQNIMSIYVKDFMKKSSRIGWKSATAKACIVSLRWILIGTTWSLALGRWAAHHRWRRHLWHDAPFGTRFRFLAFGSAPSFSHAFFGCLYLSQSLPVCLSCRSVHFSFLCPYVCVYIYMHIYIYMYVYIHIYIFIYVILA